MSDARAARYEPADRLHLWLLTRPEQPVLIGALNLLRSTQGVSLQYSDGWRERGFPLSGDLPLLPDEFLPLEKGTAVGAVDDARPDRWGERVIRFIDEPARLSLLECLYFAGDDKACEVTRGDIELYAEHIDRPFLKDQRAPVRGTRQ